MKRFLHYITCCSLLALVACTHDDIELPQGPVGDGRITIQSSLDNMVITRATVADSEKERTVEHIDIFVVNKATGVIAYYERNTSSGNNSGSATNGAGTLTLNVARRAKDANDNYIFAADASYSFYLVANSTLSQTDMAAITTLDGLKVLVQDDSFVPNFATEGSENGPSHSRQTLLHLSGTQQGENPDFKAPQLFLMDAVATDDSNATSWVVNPSSGSLNNLSLKAEFKRAASKIIVNITQGPDVEFHQALGDQSSQYDFYKLPASTLVLSPDENVSLVDVQLINTAPLGPNDETFIWQSADAAASNKLQIIGYTYAHSWGNDNLTNETSLILNIPMKWNKDNSDDHSKEAEASKSWYKVPLSQSKMFERNKCYEVNITINAVGAANRSTAIELRDIEYRTLEWESVGIDVGDSDERPEFLVLNTDLVEMYNVNFDNSSLEFSSSSPIASVTLEDVYTQNADGSFTSATDGYSAYYINKFGIKTNLDNTVRGTISATAEADVLNGGISILSPILNTTEEQRKLAIAALGNEPIVPSKPNTSGMPDPNSYLGLNKDYRTYDEDELPTANYSNRNTEYTIYRYNAEKETFQSATYKCIFSYNNYTYSWELQGDWVDIDPPATYTTALNEWIAQHPEYEEYYNAKQKYDAYQAAVKAINASANVGETHYNTIRYLEFEVKNEQGLTATFRVMQYPTIYITNIEGYYSYRSDFVANNGTIVHFQNMAANYLTQAYWANYEIQKQTGTNTWTTEASGYGSVYGNQQTNTRYADGQTLTSQRNSAYYYTYEKDGATYRKRYTNLSGVFNSDVRIGAAYGSTNDNPGRSNLDSYYIDDNNRAWKYTGSKDPGNHRMYHVRVTVSSSDYVIGRPRLVDAEGNPTTNVEIGQTDDSAENSLLVSPSFMLASQLGVTSSVSLSLSNGKAGDSPYQRAVEQCKNYVETTYDDTNGNGIWDSGETVYHYNDWRLPTAAEIAIIAKLQYGSVAVDEVLAGQYYFCASPTRYANGNTNGTDGGFIRCIRDAY